MRKYNTAFGMDVHSRSVTVCAVVFETGETESKKFINCPSPAEIAGWMERFPAPHYAAYESGCTGFYMARSLRELGIDCDVIATSSIPRTQKEAKKKSDKLDAKKLVREILNSANSLSAVWLPDEETEGARAISRAHADAVKAMKVAKQQLLSLLLANGVVYDERTATGTRKKPFTKDFYRWLNTVDLGDVGKTLALGMLKEAAVDAIEREKRCRAAMLEYADSERWKPFVDGLSTIKGVGEAGAFAYAAEIGDFNRFKSARRLPSWVGLTPSQSDSGEKSSSGKITKAGNAHLRRYLLEGTNGLVFAANATTKQTTKNQVVSDLVRAHTKKGTRRLVDRSKHLKTRGKKSNIIKVAIASELIKWVWTTGLLIQQEQEAMRS